jgi:hypothetical protein
MAPRTALALLVALVSALTLYANASHLVEDREALRFFPPFVAGFDGNANQHLGAEYLNIARALVSGRGFADPFFVESGPTAWMPPFYPLLLAGLLYTTGSGAAVAAIGVVAKGVVLVLTGMLVFYGARRSARHLRPEIALLAYAVWITAHFDWFFQITHDVWLLLLLVDGVLFGAWRLLENGSKRREFLGWGALGGVAALAIGAAWVATTLFLGWKKRAGRNALVSLALAAALVSPWVARNYAVFGELVLVKSNLAYDLYQANYVSHSGVYDEPFLLRHPVWTTMRDPESIYRTRGESAFLAQYRARLRVAFSKEPAVAVRGAAQRALAATLLYRPYRPRTEGRHPLLRSAIHPLPFLGLLALLALRRGRLAEPMAAAALVYAVALAPYVLAAFYLRYLLPLTPALALFVFWGADTLAASRRGPAPI